MTSKVRAHPFSYRFLTQFSNELSVAHIRESCPLWLCWTGCNCDGVRIMLQSSCIQHQTCATNNYLKLELCTNVYLKAGRYYAYYYSFVFSGVLSASRSVQKPSAIPANRCLQTTKKERKTGCSFLNSFLPFFCVCTVSCLLLCVCSLLLLVC